MTGAGDSHLCCDGSAPGTPRPWGDGCLGPGLGARWGQRGRGCLCKRGLQGPGLGVGGGLGTLGEVPALPPPHSQSALVTREQATPRALGLVPKNKGAQSRNVGGSGGALAAVSVPYPRGSWLCVGRAPGPITNKSAFRPPRGLRELLPRVELCLLLHLVSGSARRVVREAGSSGPLPQ